MNKGPNVCGDDGKMPEDYTHIPPEILEKNSGDYTHPKYFLYGVEAQVHPCTPDILPRDEITMGSKVGGKYYIELGGKRWFFFERDIVQMPDGTVKLDGNVYSEI